MTEIRTGVYEHYKGKRYRVIVIAKDESTLEDMVVYEALYENAVSRYWVRPASLFNEVITVDAYRGPRFRFIGA